MNYFLLAFPYIISDPFFWPSMSFTTLIGIFIGSVIYDGDLKQVKRGIILLLGYVMMIILVTLTRVMPLVNTTQHQERPLAGIATIILVTFFYLLGMFLGVFITRKAHGHRVV